MENQKPHNTQLLANTSSYWENKKNSGGQQRIICLNIFYILHGPNTFPSPVSKSQGKPPYIPASFFFFFTSAIGSISLLFLDNNLIPLPSAHWSSKKKHYQKTLATKVTKKSGEGNSRRTVTQDLMLCICIRCIKPIIAMFVLTWYIP